MDGDGQRTFVLRMIEQNEAYNVGAEQVEYLGDQLELAPATQVDRLARPDVQAVVGVVLVGAAEGRRSGDALPQERPRERGDDERDGRRAQHQERPVPDAPPPHRLVRNPPHEHQRREFDDALLLALNQVDEYRDGDRAQTEQEGRS